MFTELITQERITIPIDLPPVVSVVTEAGREAAEAVVVMGFSTDPVARWMYPGAQEYLTHFLAFINALAGKSFDARSAYAAADFSGAALWLPPGVEPDEQELIRLAQATVNPKLVGDLFAIFDQMGANHPDEPHWYLPMIAADTVKQNRGVGSALLTYSLERCDREGLPAYLESSNPRNISLYRRFGFEVVGEIQAGTSPSMYPMLRRPARTF